MINQNRRKKSHRRMKSSMKTLALLLSVVLIMGAVIGGTIAYLQTDSQSVTNSFVEGHVGCEVAKDGDNYIVKPDAETNTSVKLRAAVVVNWVDGDGNVYWQAPNIEKVEGTDWSKNDTDGFYYYLKDVPVSDKDNVPSLKITTSGTKPDGYELQIQVLGEAIQAKPDAAPAVWTNGG